MVLKVIEHTHDCSFLRFFKKNICKIPVPPMTMITSAPSLIAILIPLSYSWQFYVII